MTREQLPEHTISILVYNNPGVLSKVMSLVTRRGFNIDSIVAEKTMKTRTRIILVVKADAKSLEQIQKQLYKIVDVLKVTLINPESKVAKEIAFIKVKATNTSKTELFQLVDVFKGEIADASPQGYVFEVVGTREKINSFISLIPENIIVEIARSGIVAVNKWPPSN